MKRTLTIAFSLYEKLMKQVIVMVLLFFSNVVHGQDALNTESWQYVKNVDEFTDEILETALVVAEGGLKNGFIAINCGSNNYFEYKVSTGKYIGNMVRATKGNFEYRVDSQPSVTVLMRPSKTLLFKNDYESPFVKALLEGKETVIIRLTDYEFEKSTAKFTLNGAKEAISKVMGSCHK